MALNVITLPDVARTLLQVLAAGDNLLVVLSGFVVVFLADSHPFLAEQLGWAGLWPGCALAALLRSSRQDRLGGAIADRFDSRR